MQPEEPHPWILGGVNLQTAADAIVRFVGASVPYPDEIPSDTVAGVRAWVRAHWRARRTGAVNRQYEALHRELVRITGRTPAWVDNFLLYLGLPAVRDFMSRSSWVPFREIGLVGGRLKNYIMAALRETRLDPQHWNNPVVPGALRSYGQEGWEDDLPRHLQPLATLFPQLQGTVLDQLRRGGNLQTFLSRVGQNPYFRGNETLFQDLFEAVRRREGLGTLEERARAVVGAGPHWDVQEAWDFIRSPDRSAALNEFQELPVSVNVAFNRHRRAWIDWIRQVYHATVPGGPSFASYRALVPRGVDHRQWLRELFFQTTAMFAGVAPAFFAWWKGLDSEAVATLGLEYLASRIQPWRLLKSAVISLGHRVNFPDAVAGLSPPQQAQHAFNLLRNLAGLRTRAVGPNYRTWLESREQDEIFNSINNVRDAVHNPIYVARGQRQERHYRLNAPQPLLHPAQLGPTLSTVRRALCTIFGIQEDRAEDSTLWAQRTMLRGQSGGWAAMTTVAGYPSAHNDGAAPRFATPNYFIVRTDGTLSLPMMIRFEVDEGGVPEIQPASVSEPEVPSFEVDEEGFARPVEASDVLDRVVGGVDTTFSLQAKVNLMFVIRQVCFRLTKDFNWLRMAGVEAPWRAQIIGRFDIKALTRRGQRRAAYCIHVITWTIAPNFTDLDGWATSVADLSQAMWTGLCDQFTRVIIDEDGQYSFKGKYNLTGQGADTFWVSRVSAKSDYVTLFVVPSLANAANAPPIRVGARELWSAWWYSTNHPGESGFAWKVSARKGPYDEDPAFAAWQPSPPCPEGFAKPCLWKVVAYLLRGMPIEPYVGLMQAGRLRAIVTKLRSSVAEVGFLVHGSLPFAEQGKSGMAIYVTPGHVSIINGAQVKTILRNYRLVKDSAEPAVFGSFRYDSQEPKGLTAEEAMPQTSVVMPEVDPDYLEGGEDDVTEALKLPLFRVGPLLSLSTTFRTNVLFWDIESFAVRGERQICYLSVMVGWEGVEWVQHVHMAHNPLEDVLDGWADVVHGIATRLAANKPQRPLRIWTFNGLKYEMKFVLKKLTARFGKVSSLGQMGSSKGWKLTDELYIMDARTLYPSGSLAANSQAVNTHYKKANFDIGAVTDFAFWKKNASSIISYCYRDCMATFQLVQRWYLNAYVMSQECAQEAMRRPPGRHELEPVPLNSLYNIMTCSQLSMMFFSWHFVGKRIIKNNEPTWITQIQRSNYFGGLTEVYKHIVTEPVHDVDVNSMYPTAMSTRLPWRYLSVHTLDASNKAYFTGLIASGRADLFYFHVTFARMPAFHGVPTKTVCGAVYTAEIMDRWLWGCQLRMVPPISYDVDRLVLYDDCDDDGQPITDVKDFVDFFYDKKKHCAPAEKGKKIIIKLVLNSLYGKWGQRRFPTHEYADFQYLRDLETDDQDIRLDEDDDYCHIVTSKGQKPYIGDYGRLAAYVTAYCRAFLASTSAICGQGNVFYCDTDSLFVNRQGFERLRAAGLLDDGDEELGKFKLQDFNKGPAVFTQGIFAARKSYALKNDRGILFKWKGVNWDGGKPSDERIADVYERAVRSVVHKCAKVADGPIVNKIDMQLAVPSNRWVWSQFKDGVVIEDYYKSLNMNPKRAITHKDGRTRQVVYNELYNFEKITVRKP